MHELLKPFMMNKHIQKVFHGHEDGVTLLSCYFSIEVPHTQIFDTRTYAGGRLCLTVRGLKEVCAVLLQYDLEISFESTDSRHRPLSTEMFNEAAIHVQLLLCLKDACEAWIQATAIEWLDDAGY